MEGMKVSEILKRLHDGTMILATEKLPPAVLNRTRSRLEELAEEFLARYGDREASLFSAPGRCEICGNHTDHNGGKAIAAAVDPDALAVVSPRNDATIRIKSAGFPEDCVDISVWREPDPGAFFTSSAIIAGLASAFVAAGRAVGGFDAVTSSDVPPGCGMSSSAAFEVLVGTILNEMYNGGRVGAEEIAAMSQYAENAFFGKPSGRLDQLASAVGGLVAMDFRNEEAPKVTPLAFLPESAGLRLYLTNTGGSHADLNPDYAAVPSEMKAVAAFFGKKRLCELNGADVWRWIPQLRTRLGDRAVLRAMHFFEETERVGRLTDALTAGEENASVKFLQTLNESGRSSLTCLQNVFSPLHPDRQGITLGLAVSERLLSGSNSAFRIHGGGFAGSVIAFVPEDRGESYRQGMDEVFGQGACHPLYIRTAGGLRLF